MTDPRRNSQKAIKKDQTGPRDARREVEEEIGSGGTKPIVRNPNRDQARGDWDRSGVRRDEGKSRAE